MNELRYFDGTKNVDISTITAERWDELFGIRTVGGGRLSDAGSAWASVGWVNRCVSIRADSVAHMPWSVFKGETEVARNDDIGKALPWLDRMGDMLYLTEAALTIVGQAYTYKSLSVGGKLLALQWFAPSTMRPVWSETSPEIDHFERRDRYGKPDIFTTDEIIYTRLLSALDEQGVAPSPVEAALADAGVLYNLNAFAQQFFARGAIKAMLLTVEGSPSPDELLKLETWWKRFFRGVRNAWETVAVRASVKPVIVGEGIGDLNNREFTDEKRESISTAMGVPHSIVMSNAANYATAQADRLSFYDFTILPDCRVIADALNRQLFRPMGLEFHFRPEALPVYQADEREASETIKNLAAAGVRPSHALLMLGRELPDGVSEDAFDEFFIGRRSSPEPQPQDNPFEAEDEAEDEDEDEAAREDEVKAFRNWVKKNPNRAARLGDFEAAYLTEDDKKAIAYDVVAKAAIGTDDEYDNRLKLEARIARKLARGLEEWLEDVLPGISEAEVNLIAARLRDGSTKFRDILQAALMESADLGVDVALDTVGQLGLAFDYTAPHVEASRWVRQHTDDLLASFNTTNDRIVGEAVARWVENSQPMEALMEDLRPWFGKRRADTIARTEVTRAYSEGSKAAYKEAGVVEKLQWKTRQDELVCPVCGPLNGVTIAIEGEAFFTDRSDVDVLVPPAHPNCRCYISPVLEGL